MKNTFSTYELTTKPTTACWLSKPTCVVTEQDATWQILCAKRKSWRMSRYLCKCRASASDSSYSPRVWVTELAGKRKEKNTEWKTTVGNSGYFTKTCFRILYRHQCEKRLAVKLAEKAWVLPRDCETDGQFITGKVSALKCVKQCTDWVETHVFCQPTWWLDTYCDDDHCAEWSPAAPRPLWCPKIGH